MTDTKPRIKPDWMHDCKFIDELSEGEVGYCMGHFIPKNKAGGWVISRNDLCSPIRRGTHSVMIVREGDEIYVRDGGMGDGVEWDGISYAAIENNCFPAHWRPFTLEEKVNILWSERR